MASGSMMQLMLFADKKREHWDASSKPGDNDGADVSETGTQQQFLTVPRPCASRSRVIGPPDSGGLAAAGLPFLGPDGPAVRVPLPPDKGG